MKWAEPIATALLAWFIAIEVMSRIFPSLYGSWLLVLASYPLAVYLSLIFTILAVLIQRPIVGNYSTK